MNNTDKNFTKEDLKNGDIVKLRDGDTMILLQDMQTLISKNCYGFFAMYDEDLKHIAVPALDIIAVRRPEISSDCWFDAFQLRLGQLIYERKEPEEMTLSEVCKALGKEIKIVKE